MTRTFACAVLALATATAGALSPEKRPASTDTVTVHLDIPYTKGLHGDLLANLYLPRKHAGKLVPLVVYIHGGAWINGSRDGLDYMAQYMGDRGIAGLDIDYDLVPEGGHFPVSLDESWQAVRWVQTHAAEYGIDPKRIAVSGGSAGGQLAALVALGVHQPAGVLPVKAAVIFNGVLEMRGTDDKQMVTNYLGAKCSAVAALCAEASPMAAVHSGAPAFYIGHGTADTTVPFAVAQAFVAALKAAGVKTVTFVAKGGPHAYFSKEPWKADNEAAVAAFLKDSL